MMLKWLYDYLIVPKGTKFRGSGKYGLNFIAIIDLQKQVFIKSIKGLFTNTCNEAWCKWKIIANIFRAPF